MLHFTGATSFDIQHISPLMIPATLTAAVETALNRWLQLDPETRHLLPQFQGRIIEWQLPEFNQSLYFFCNGEYFQVLAQYEGKVDTLLIAKLSGLARSMNKQAEKALFDGDLKISGDTELGQAFQKLLTSVDFDWEEQLSHLTGDIVAHQIGNAVRSFQQLFSKTGNTFTDNLSEFLQEEARILASKSEIDSFMRGVDELRSDTDRLEARIHRLLNREDKHL